MKSENILASNDVKKPRHFVVVAWGSIGDVYPFLGIALALKSNGYRVTLLANQAYAISARQIGLEFFQVGTIRDARAPLSNPDLFLPGKSFEVIWRSCLPMQELITDFILNQPDVSEIVVIAHPLAMLGATTARDLMPSVTLIGAFLAPSNLQTSLDRITLPDINLLRTRHDLPSVDKYADILYGAPNLSLTLFPEWFGPPPFDWIYNLSYGDFPLFNGIGEQSLSDDVREFLAVGEPPIVFTFGSAMHQAGNLFETSLLTCMGLNRRGIFLSAYGAQIPSNLPAMVKWFPYVSLRHLLSHAVAVVHPGGIGTIAEALRSGVPQIIVPMVNDQFDNCSRVETLGVGLRIENKAYSAKTLTAALRYLLSDHSILANCRAVAAQFNERDPAQIICERIEEMLK